MAFLLSLGKGKKYQCFFTIVLQLFFFLSIYQINDVLEIRSIKIISVLIFFELLILFIFYSIIYKRYQSFSIFFFFLLLINFLTTPLFYLSAPKFVTLKPNLKKTFIINSNVMPGFTGISNISTDQKGFRTNKVINYDFKDNNIYRIFTIGASTIEQIYLDDLKTTSALLEQFLQSKIQNKKIEVINTGVSGLRAQHHYETFLQIKKYSPDLVIFMMGINDMNADIISCINNQAKIKEESLEIICPQKFINLEQSLKITSKYPYSTTENSFAISQSIIWKSLKNLSIYIAYTYKNKKYFANFLIGNKKNLNFIEYEDGSYYSQQNNSLTRQIKKRIKLNDISQQYKFYIDSIVKLCHYHKETKCLFVNQASAYKKNVTEDLKRLFWMTPPNQSYTLELENLILAMNFYNDWLITYSKKNKIDHCDIQESVPATVDYFYDDVHFNEKGAKEVALNIFKCLDLP